ncbi:MAG: hypothetical protein A2804_01285 [Candidatus Pacebacteria bacterium RIFCSPHIGHO2_01_FULL_46_10]|nr:MAG: hypothetical protein A2804_01285 [Candidatus Pacebacteria bacterium RIFCSPHIGHO2_01_FULL_46_10]
MSISSLKKKASLRLSKVVSVRDFSRNLSYYVNEINHGSLSLTKHGKVVAVLSPSSIKKKAPHLMDLDFFKHPAKHPEWERQTSGHIAKALRKNAWSRTA